MSQTYHTHGAERLESDGAESQRWLEEHGDVLYRYALSKVRLPEVAEDLVQETLLAAWKGRARFRRQSQVRTWLVSILKRKVIDWLRATIREQKAKTKLEDDWLNKQFTSRGTWREKPTDWQRNSPDAELTRTEFWQTFESCLDKLPPRLRQVFVLWQLDEKSGEEVCQELKISTSNLWVMLHRSRLRLWRCLNLNWYNQPDDDATPPKERS